MTASSLLSCFGDLEGQRLAGLVGQEAEGEERGDRDQSRSGQSGADKRHLQDGQGLPEDRGHVSL